MRIKRLNTFQEYQKEQKMNESNVSVEVDWWDQAIVEVFQELEDECNGLFDWTTLGNFIKAKFSILGRTFDEYIDNIFILHIKDLIFQFHGKSFCLDATGNDNTAIHTKGLVIEKLAREIYDKLSDKLSSGTDPNKATVNLVDNEPATMVPMKPATVVSDDDDFFDDLPFESRNVKTFEEYIKEAVATKLKPEDSNACVDYCLNRIEREAGSLDPDAIFDAAVKYADDRAKARMVAMYVRPMVEDCLNDSNVVICNLDETDDEQKQDRLIGDALDTLMDRITDDVLYAIYKVNGGKDVETK